MRVLVTGGAGFIGQHVVRALAKEGDEVYALDYNFAGIRMVPSIREVSGDITIALPFPGMPNEIDCVVHLAAIAAPRECDNNPMLAFNVNVNGTHMVLRYALGAKAKRVVFASTAHVYGISPRYMPTDERHPLWLQDTYTTTKILGEALCERFYDNHDLPYCVLRMFNGYGPGQSLGYFIPDMIEKAQSGRIQLGGSNTTKDFVYIEDIADAYVKAVHSDFVGHLNIGSGVESQLGSVARRIASHFGVGFVDKPADNATRMQCDFKRAQRVLDWAPLVSLEDGLQRTIEASR